MHSRPHSVLIAATGVALSLTLAACAGSDPGTTAGSSGESGRLDGVSLTVGSKDFTENILVGEIFAQALESEGASVTKQINLGGTVVNREALMAGDIDVYPEYNGTGWTVHLGQQDPSQDPTELTAQTAAMDLEENNIKWIGQSALNDTYGFAANGDLAAAEGEFDFDSMAAYLAANPSASLCLETEFPNRPDGLILFEKATGFTVPDNQVTILDTGLIYTETASGTCDFGEVFTTDGRLSALNLSLVKDPGVMILYNISFTMSSDLYDANSAVYDELADKILSDLDNDTMAQLNARVDVDGELAEDVAQQYLTDIGVLS